MTRVEELEEKLKELCEEYSDMEVFTIINDNGTLGFCGTGCPVCASVLITEWVKGRNIQHKYNEINSVN